MRAEFEAFDGFFHLVVEDFFDELRLLAVHAELDAFLKECVIDRFVFEGRQAELVCRAQ
jgi:hypothetical protein